MGKVLAFAACAWPALLAFAWWERVHDPAAMPGLALYLAASTVCHQIADRSFHTAGVAWPVCGRCAGLYLSAPVGAWLGLWIARRRKRLERASQMLAVAAIPTLLTAVVEWLGLSSVGNALRFVAALPLGVAVAAIIVATAESGVRYPVRAGSR